MVANKWRGFASIFSYRLCGMLPDRGHKFHSTLTAGPGVPSPPPPGLMPPEPCHCCEEPDRTPSIQMAVNLSQVYLTANQTLVTQAISRSTGRTGSPHTSDTTSSRLLVMQYSSLSCRAALSCRQILCRVRRTDGKRENSISFMFYYHSSASLLIQASGAKH